MKIRVDRDVLAEALAWVARALPTRPVVPVLSGLRLDAGTRLTLSCFDYEVSATAQIQAEVNPAAHPLEQGLSAHARRNPEDSIQAKQQHTNNQSNLVLEILLHGSVSLVQIAKIPPEP